MYRLQLATDSSFASTVLDDSTVTDTSRPLSGLSNSTQYHWRVNGRNNGGSGPWSQIFRFTTAPITNTYAVAAGWNMISVPLTVSDGRTTSLFPTAVSEAYRYVQGVGYARRDTLVNREGYWLKFNSSQTVSISGSERVQDTIVVNAGWNTVGSISFPVEVDSIVQVPGGIIQSGFFTFDGSYIPTSTVDPGKSYWVRASAPGQLILQGNASTVTERREGLK